MEALEVNAAGEHLHFSPAKPSDGQFPRERGRRGREEIDQGQDRGCRQPGAGMVQVCPVQGQRPQAA
jgi:hypothetical protein